MSQKLISQTKNAFDFVEKLYFEVSYLIKEIEGLLQQEKEVFIIGRPSGYGVTTRSSSGLEAVNVSQWLTKSFTVFFCPENMTKINGGQTITEFKDGLKILIVQIVLAGKEINEPIINFGCISDINTKKESHKKFEHLMWEFSHNGDKIFNSQAKAYEDNYCSFRKEFLTNSLYAINNSDDIVKKVINPLLQIYRSSQELA